MLITAVSICGSGGGEVGIGGSEVRAPEGVSLTQALTRTVHDKVVAVRTCPDAFRKRLCGQDKS